jgi:uncharacterized DUF497 family protein
MRFEWDEAKRKANLMRHGFDFLDGEDVFNGETYSFLDDRFSYGETRFLTFGMLRGQVVAIIHAENDEAIRMISIRRQGRMRKKLTSRKSETDWKRIDAMKDEDIDLSDNPEVPPEMFARGIIRRGLKPVRRKDQLTLRVDSDVLSWYRKLGSGYQTKINALLRAYMEEHQRSKA